MQSWSAKETTTPLMSQVLDLLEVPKRYIYGDRDHFYVQQWWSGIN